MKKLKIAKNFHNPRVFCRKHTYRSLFDHKEVIEAFNWASVSLNKHFEEYYFYKAEEKEAKKGILKVLACAPE